MKRALIAFALLVPQASNAPMSKDQLLQRAAAYELEGAKYRLEVSRITIEEQAAKIAELTDQLKECRAGSK